MVRAHAAGLLASAGLSAWLWRGHRPEDIQWIVALSGTLLFITLTTQFWYHLAAYATLWLGKRTPWELECSERGVHIRTKDWQYFGAWTVFPKYRETGSAFLLYIDPTYYYLLPMRSMSNAEQERLREMLRSRLTAAD